MKLSFSFRAASLFMLGLALAFGNGGVRAAGTITGVVFEDFNGNGVRDTATTVPNSSGAGATTQAVDRGWAGLTISAYDSDGVLRGTAISGAGGVYSLVATGTGPYRVEFTNLPAGYRPSAQAPGATGNGTTVQFVSDGDTADVNLGILDGASYCQNNPTLVTSCYVFGDQTTGDFSTSPVLVDFPYAAGANSGVEADYFVPGTHTLMVPANQIGSVYGLGYARGATSLYAGAFMKKHAGFGPSGTGAIYAVNAAGAAVLFADLNAIFGANTAGANPHDTTNYLRDNDNVAWDAVGKVALGGVEVSPDGATVYAINLQDRRLYALPTTGPLTAATVRRVSIPLNAPGATGVGGADLRPFAVEWYRGRLYVGIVNSAESTGLSSDLIAYVYAVDPATLTFDASPAFQFSLQYPRGSIQTFNGVGPGEWMAWRTTFATQSPSGVGTYPQPMLSGLSFDADGNLVLGLRDRAGDQFGFFAQSEPGSSALWEGVGGGETLLAAINTPGDLTSGWTLESNAQAGLFGPTAGANNGEGPGTAGGFGEFFFADRFAGFHNETTAGATLQVPGFPNVVSSGINPGLTLRTGGFMWFDRMTGAKSKGYNLYSAGFADPTEGAFSKANGLGDVVAICQAAPIEVGNRIWDDVDGDGVQDAGEAGLDGVVVQLIAPDGVTVIGSATTANGGQYYFSSAAGSSTGNTVYNIAALTPNTAGFRIRVASGQAALGGRFLTVANADGSANGDSRDSDGVTAGANADVTFTTGAAGANDHTLDVGYTTFETPLVSLGNYVWIDTNNDGVVSPGELGRDGVTVRLFEATGTVLLGTQVTAGGGFYLFTGLMPGTYVVEAVTPTGFTSSTGGGTEPASDPDNDLDNDDNGTTFGALVRSLPVTLTVGGEPINDGDSDPNSNLTVDFGFVPIEGGPPPPGIEVGGADICLLQAVPATVTPGGLLTTTYTAVNRGPNPATDVMIDGMIPANTTFVSATPSAGGTCTVTAGVLDCVWPGETPVGPAGNRTVTLVLQADPSVTPGQTIWLWFMAGSTTLEPYPFNNVLDANVFVTGGPVTPVDLVITGTAQSGGLTGPAVATIAGQPATVRFSVANNGSAPARGFYAILLDDATAVRFTGVSYSQGQVAASNPTAGAWDTGFIAPGTTATLDITMVAVTGTAAKLVAVRLTGSPADPDAANDTAEVALDAVGPASGRFVAVGNVDGIAGGELLTGSGRGESAQVQIVSGTGAPLWSFYAFDRAFLGGVRVAACDVNADGIDELVAAQGPGGGRVRVLGLAGTVVTELAAFDAYETSFTGGVNVACADLDGDGRAEVVVGPDGGRAPDVKVFSVGVTAVVTAQFQAYEPAFTGGVRVSAARFAGSALVGAFNIATASGPGRATELRLWQQTGASAAQALAVPFFGTTGGARVALGDINGDGGLDVAIVPDGATPVLVQAYALTTGALLLDAPTGTGGYTGINVAIGRLTGGPGAPELVVGSGPSMVPTVRTFVFTPGPSQRLSLTVLEQP